MTTLQRRRLRNLLLVVTGVAVFAVWQWSQPMIGLTAHFVTGWTMFVGLLMLVLFNVRKKLSFLPLGRVSAWTQFHIHGGLFLTGLFLLHTELRAPTGMFGTTLYVLFVLTVVSGGLGLLLSRRLPRRIRQTGIEMTYHRIPLRLTAIRKEMEARVLEAAGTSGSRGLAELYERVLQPWVGRPRDRWAHLLVTDRPHERRQRAMREYERVLAPAEAEGLRSIMPLIREKHLLDQIHAQEWLLRHWLFWHIPLALVLVLLAGIHLITVHAFVGSLL
jgi:hypothetical protein